MNAPENSLQLNREKASKIFRQCFYSEENGALKKILHSPWQVFRTHAGRKIAESLERSWQAKARLFWGEEMTVLVPDGVGIHLRRYGYFEKNLTDFFLQVIEPGDVFMDVGAHFGYFSLLASSLSGREGRVLSIEPTPRTFKILKKNAVSHENIMCLECAATSAEHDVYIQDMGTGQAAFNHVENEDMGHCVKVRGRRLDEVLEEVCLIPRVIKVDAERHEMEVLKGLEKTLREHSPIITLEVGDDSTEESRSGDLIAYMKTAGYDPYEIAAGRCVPHVPRRHYSYDNLAFLKPERMVKLTSRFLSHP
jgi:FkbM family methyltransferase